MVEVLKRTTKNIDDSITNSSDSAFAIEHITMYRYYKNADSDGNDHQLKMVLSPASVAMAMSEGSKTAAQLLNLDDDGIVTGSVKIEDYANVTYKYYTDPGETGDPFDTTDVDTSEGGVGGDNENLHTEYGGSAFDETDFVKSQTIRKDYGGYLGTRTFFYMEKNEEEGAGLNEVTRIIVEDTTDTGTRRIYGMNKECKTLREISWTTPTTRPSIGVNPLLWARLKMPT